MPKIHIIGDRKKSKVNTDLARILNKYDEEEKRRKKLEGRRKKLEEKLGKTEMQIKTPEQLKGLSLEKVIRLCNKVENWEYKKEGYLVPKEMYIGKINDLTIIIRKDSELDNPYLAGALGSKISIWYTLKVIYQKKDIYFTHGAKNVKKIYDEIDAKRKVKIEEENRKKIEEGITYAKTYQNKFKSKKIKLNKLPKGRR